MTSEAYASWEIMFWIRRGRSPRANSQLSISGKAPLPFAPWRSCVNLCSVHLYVASIQAAGNCAWERESEWNSQAGFQKQHHTSEPQHEGATTIPISVTRWCGVTCGARAEGQDEGSSSCPVIYTSLLPSCALVSSMEKNEWDKLPTVHTGFTVGESAWVLTHK